MPDTPTAGLPRRRFLTRLGATFAAGLGFTAFGASSADARGRGVVRAAPSDAQVARDTQACAIYCYATSCPGGCPPYKNIFRCVDRCSGTWYSCLQHNCSNYCLSSNAC